MKLLLLGLVVLVGAAALLLWRNGGGPVSSLPFHAAAKKAPKPALPLPESRPASKSARAVKAGEAVAAADPIAVQPNQPEERNASLTARPRISTPHPPFPLADKIALGTGEDAVTSAYGTPSAWAVTSEDGQIVETLVYALEREHLETVIRIVDGKVAAVYTKAPPASPRGSLIRTLGQ